MADATSLTPPRPILLKPALGASEMLLFSVALMNRLNKTESDIFATCMIPLLLKDLPF